MSPNIIAQPKNYVNNNAITVSIILKSIGKNKIKKITIPPHFDKIFHQKVLH